MKKILFAGLLVVVALGCKKHENAEKGKIKAADWLIGNWENNTKQGRLSESWEKANDSTFNGTSYFLKGKDTLNNEAIVLMQKGNDLFYVSTVTGQNNDKPVVFKMTKGNAKQMVFENAKHDYPQKVTYTQMAKDSMVAEISGIENGKPASESYPMNRK